MISKTAKMERGKDWFYKLEEIGDVPLDDPQIQGILKSGIASGFQVWGPLRDWHIDLIKKHDGVILWNQPADKTEISMWAAKYKKFLEEDKEWENRLDKTSSESSDIRKFVYNIGKGQMELSACLGREINKAADLSDKSGKRFWWCPMGEFDSSGIGYIRLAREKSYKTGKEFYDDMTRWFKKHVKKCLDRKDSILLTTISGFAYTTHYIYEWGFELGKIERHNDHIGDLSMGIAFMRGAASQYDKPWGLDISRFRSCGRNAGGYDPEMRRNGGWSENYTKKHYFLGYMAGANVIKQEQSVIAENACDEGFYFITDKKTGAVRETPMGKVAREFGDFAFNRCADRGVPFVPFALLMDFYQGWSYEGPFFSGTWSGSYKWFGKIPQSPGDRMKEKFFDEIFPNHKHSGVPPEAPWTYNVVKTIDDTETHKKYIELVRDGLDTRPYEPMSITPFGDSFDVILNNCAVDTLKKYKAVFLLGEIKLDSALREKLEEYTASGGAVVANITNIRKCDFDFFGVKAGGGKKKSVWKPFIKCNICGESFPDRVFETETVIPEDCAVLAEVEKTQTTYLNLDKSGQTDAGLPIITARKIGAGQAALTTVPRMLSERDMVTLKIFPHYIGHLLREFSPAELSGDPCEFMLNRRENGDLLITVANNFSETWRGAVSIKEPGHYNSDVTGGTGKISGFGAGVDGKRSARMELPPHEIAVFEFKKQ